MAEKREVNVVRVAIEGVGSFMMVVKNMESFEVVVKRPRKENYVRRSRSLGLVLSMLVENACLQKIIREDVCMGSVKEGNLPIFYTSKFELINALF